MTILDALLTEAVREAHPRTVTEAAVGRPLPVQEEDTVMTIEGVMIPLLFKVARGLTEMQEVTGRNSYILHQLPASIFLRISSSISLYITLFVITWTESLHIPDVSSTLKPSTTDNNGSFS